jgi:glycosyltransferase involved in cell wall biosynthesis
VVHGFLPKSSLAAAIAGAMGGAPVVLASRRNLGYHYTARTLMITRILNRFVTRIVANSQAARSVTVEREGVCADKIDVVYNGVDTEKFYPAGVMPENPAVAIPSGLRVVGIVANYRPVKNLELFLRSAAIVARKVPDACFLLVGSGTMESALRSLAEELGIAGQVIFTSGRGTVLPYLHRMCIGCLCSSSEGFSNSILEYMAAGLPVVATDVGGNAEAVLQGQTGFLIKEASPETFAAPIIRLLEDEQLRNQLGRNGLERCRSEFELGHAAKRLAQYYEWLLGRPSANGASA